MADSGNEFFGFFGTGNFVLHVLSPRADKEPIKFFLSYHGSEWAVKLTSLEILRNSF